MLYNENSIHPANCKFENLKLSFFVFNIENLKNVVSNCMINISISISQLQYHPKLKCHSRIVNPFRVIKKIET